MSKSTVFILASLAFFCGFAEARTPGASSRALGMGDAVRALGLGTAGLYFNPACMSQMLQYAVDSGYGYQGLDRIHNFHVSISDSKTNPYVAGGVGYTYGQSQQTGFKSHDVRVGLSTAFGDENLRAGVGAGYRYLRASDRNTFASTGALDVGAFLSYQGVLHIGVAGQNLISRSAKYAPKLFGFGFAITVKGVGIASDVVLDFDSRKSVTASPGFGFEYVVLGAVAVRAGFGWDRSQVPDKKRVTGGLGYISQYVGVDVGYAHDVRNKSDWIVESSIRIFLP